MARFAFAKPDVIHMQWLGAPELDRWLFRPRSPAVLTAHDIIPRRTLSKTAMWKTLFGRFERVVVHSERGRGCSSSTSGWQPRSVRVIGHPVFRSEVDPSGRRADCALSRSHPAVQGDGGRGRGRARRRRRAAARRRRSRVCPSTASARPPASGQSGDSATSPTRSFAARSRRRPSPCFRTASRDRRLRRAPPGARRGRAGDRLRHRRSRRGRRSLRSRCGRAGRATRTRCPPRSRGSSGTPTRSRPLVRRRAGARGADMGRVCGRAHRSLPGAHVIFRRTPLRRSRRAAARPLRVGDGALRRGSRGRRSVDDRQRRRVRGALRRLPARRRRDRRARFTTCGRRTRRHSTTAWQTTTGAAFERAARKRFGRSAAFLGGD